MKSSFKRKGLSDKIFIIVDYVILTILLILILYPLLYVIMASVSGGPNTMSIYLIPMKQCLLIRTSGQDMPIP